MAKKRIRKRKEKPKGGFAAIAKSFKESRFGGGKVRFGDKPKPKPKKKKKNS